MSHFSYVFNQVCVSTRKEIFFCFFLWRPSWRVVSWLITPLTVMFTIVSRWYDFFFEPAMWLKEFNQLSCVQWMWSTHTSKKAFWCYSCSCHVEFWIKGSSFVDNVVLDGLDSLLSSWCINVAFDLCDDFNFFQVVLCGRRVRKRFQVELLMSTQTRNSCWVGILKERFWCRNVDTVIFEYYGQSSSVLLGWVDFFLWTRSLCCSRKGHGFAKAKEKCILHLSWKVPALSWCSLWLLKGALLSCSDTVCRESATKDFYLAKGTGRIPLLLVRSESVFEVVLSCMA